MLLPILLLAASHADVLAQTTPAASPGPTMPSFKPAPHFKAKPKPKPSPHPLGIKPLVPPKKLVVNPNTKAAKVLPPPSTQFTLASAGAGKLTIAFTSRDPNLEWNPQAWFAIQVSGGSGVTVDPPVLNRGNWPKGALSMPLTYTGGTPGKEIRFLGDASYQVCTHATHECRRTKSAIIARIKP
jgi:hypothetical protein